MGKRLRQPEGPNPHGPEDRNPYPAERPARALTNTKGPNMLGQELQSGARHGKSFPHVESHDDDDDWQNKRASIRKSMANSSGRY